MNTVLLMTLAVTLLVFALPAASQSTSDVFVLRRANLIDGTSARARHNMTVVVRAGRIEIVSRRGVGVPRGAKVFNLAGRWLLPGLIDTHVHLRDLDSARRALRFGVTAARSLGVPHFADIDMRQRHRSGASDIPDVITAGYHVRRRLAQEFFVDAPQLRRMADGLHGTEDVKQVVRLMIGRGADTIKVMATERAGTLETDPLKRVLTDEELASVVAEAESAGLPVAAHAHSDEGVRAAVLAGARTIEHGTLAAKETLALMQKRGTCLVPTISFWQDMMHPGGEYDDPRLVTRAKEMLPRVREVTALARKVQVVIAAGSDMRYDANSTLVLADEIRELVGAGLPPMEAIRAGTSAAAGCIGISARTGAIKRALEADMIVVDRNPLEDIRALRNPVMVINNGHIIINRLGQASN